jgi:uncharacterized protein GlcG (DUF336 family)
MRERMKLDGCAIAALLALAALGAPPAAQAQEHGREQAREQAKNCPVTHEQLVKVLRESVKASGGPSNGGFDTNEWAAVVNRQGTVCDVAFSGKKPTDQWPGSRGIAIEKANTANDFSLDKYAISTANLWGATQPGESLYGLAASSPPIGQEILSGDPVKYGSASDPVVGRRPGGAVLFAGGLALYDGKAVVGGLGMSGDTSCADHNIAWRVRQKLGLDKVPDGPSPAHNDEIVYDVGSNGKSASGWGHPECGKNAQQVAMQIGAGTANAQPTEQSGQSTPPAHGSQGLPNFEKK